jgi:hypothetical protein
MVEGRQASRSLILIKPPSNQIYPKVFGCNAMASASEVITSAVAELSLPFPDIQHCV